MLCSDLFIVYLKFYKIENNAVFKVNFELPTNVNVLIKNEGELEVN